MSYDDTSSEGGPKGTFENYRAEGDVMFKQHEYEKAIERYNTALELRPNDISCLIARSKCYQELGDLEKALKDSDEVLKEENNHVKGILQKAEVLYSMGDFETALMFFHRGKKMRPEIREFTLGIQKSTSAIENAVGPESGVKLRSSGDLSYFYEAQEQKQTRKKGYSKPASRKEEKKKERSHSAKQDTKTIKELLGELYADREYLDNLWREIDENGAKTKTNEEIKELALEGLRYLNSRTEFWQQQKPMYSRKRDKEMRDGTRRRANSAGGTKKERTQWVIQKLEEIDDAQVEGEYEKSLKMAKKVLKDIERWSDDDLHNKAELVASLHSSMGNAYLEMNEYEKALKEHNKDLEIAKAENLEDAKSRALDNLGRVYARMSKFQEAIDVWQDKLPMAKSALEKTWLYHEIGRCYLELGEFEKAEDNGEKSLAAAQEANDEVWQLNATVLIAQSQVKTGELEASIDTFEKALEMARLQDDKQAENAIKKALDDVNKKIVKGIKDEEEGSTGRRSASPHQDTNDDKESGKDDKCKWTVTIYTTDMKGAGTDANVYLIMYGSVKDKSDVKSEKITLDNKDNNFESGQVDKFEVESLNFDKVEKIRIGHDNSGMCSGWHLEKVELTNQSSKKTFVFHCDRWLADDEDDHAIERELTEGAKKKSKDPVAWTVKVYTSDEHGAGTDANVYVTLFGKFDGHENVQSDKINLDNKGNNFEQGKCDTFEIETYDYDKVDKILIGHDGSGMFAGWHLNKVELQNKASMRKYTFICNNWLDDDKGDKKTERMLTVEKEEKQSKSKDKQSKGNTSQDKGKSSTNNQPSNKQPPHDKGKGHGKEKGQGKENAPPNRTKDKDNMQANKGKGKDTSQANKAKGHKDDSQRSKTKGHEKGKKGVK